MIINGILTYNECITPKRKSKLEEIARIESFNKFESIVSKYYPDFEVVPDGLKIFKCQYCGKDEREDIGSWNQTPYLFFCSEECHEKFDTKDS